MQRASKAVNQRSGDEAEVNEQAAADEKNLFNVDVFANGEYNGKYKAGKRKRGAESQARRTTERRARAGVLRSDAIFFDAAVERGAAQAQSFGGLRDVAVGTAQNLANELRFHIFNAHRVRRGCGRTGGSDGEI